MWHRLILACLATLALACTSGLNSPNGATIPPHELLAGGPLAEGQDALVLIESDEVLAVSHEMEKFLDANVHRKASSQVRLRELIDSIVDEGTFGIEYEGATRTASETFGLRRGNCLSFSNMFVAMARYVGLEAIYQEVDIPPDWGFEDDVFLLNRHVNVSVDLGSYGQHVVDVNIDDFSTSYDVRAISDTRAMAHYYNNMGVEHMQADDVAAALGYFRRALGENDRRFSPAWTNLGTLYLRAGHPEYAEAAYLQALKVDPEDLVAMSNLVGYYESRGDVALAADYRRQVAHHRMQNPYYRYQRAREAFLEKNYDTAIDHLKYAIRKNKNEDQFYFLLGMSYLQKGDEKKARHWLGRAEEVAATDAVKRRYASKMDLLLSASN
jgi:Flp pilus assembly protein TadD